MDLTSAPLADYFWIAGIDSLSYGEAPNPSANAVRDKATNGVVTSPPVETTIAEDNEGDAVEPISESTSRATARHSRNNSWHRLSQLSNDARNSIQSHDSGDQTKSNRSSVTFRADQTPSVNGHRGSLTEFDFDTVLLKFACERETFLSDLSFSAGTVLQNRPPMTSKAERIRHDEPDTNGTNGRKSPFGKVGGSIRRKMSFRDLGSLRRQPTTRPPSAARTSSRASESENFSSCMFSLTISHYSFCIDCDIESLGSYFLRGLSPSFYISEPVGPKIKHCNA